MEEIDRKILAEEGPRKKISKEYLMEEDEKTSDRVRSLETDLLLWKYIRGYECKQCATPLFWNIIEDKCLNCAYIEYGEEPSTRYDCRDSQCGNLRVSCSLEEEKVRKERMTMKSWKKNPEVHCTTDDKQTTKAVALKTAFCPRRSVFTLEQTTTTTMGDCGHLIALSPKQKAKRISMEIEEEQRKRKDREDKGEDNNKKEKFTETKSQSTLEPDSKPEQPDQRKLDTQ